MTFFSRKSSRGFTLVELLVVIAIISLLTSVVLSSLSLARAKSRDTARLEALHQIQVALELYRSNNASYPATFAGSSVTFRLNCGGSAYGLTGASGWVPSLAPSYMASLPTDPKPILPNNCYAYASNGTDYMILAYGTMETYTTTSNPKPRPSNPTEADFAAYTSGAEQW